MNVLLSFFKSRDGLVAVAAVLLLAGISQYNGPYNPWINLLARVGNILIFVYILWRVAGKKLVTSIAVRRSSIAEEMQNLEQQKQKAKDHLEELESRLSGLDAECQSILEESRIQAENIRKTIIAEAEAEAQRIREQALRTADSEAKAAADALRARIADEIVLAVEKNLQSRLATSRKSSGGKSGGKSRKSSGSKDDSAYTGHEALIDNALNRVVFP